MNILIVLVGLIIAVFISFSIIKNIYKKNKSKLQKKSLIKEIEENLYIKRIETYETITDNKWKYIFFLILFVYPILINKLLSGESSDFQILLILFFTAFLIISLLRIIENCIAKWYLNKDLSTSKEEILIINKKEKTIRYLNSYKEYKIEDINKVNVNCWEYVLRGRSPKMTINYCDIEIIMKNGLNIELYNGESLNNGIKILNILGEKDAIKELNNQKRKIYSERLIYILVILFIIIMSFN